MLNNIVYFNNISYMGFMDHSGYDDVSIKNMVVEEVHITRTTKPGRSRLISIRIWKTLSVD